MNNLKWLMKWYKSVPSLNDNVSRIHIYNLDNPGWSVDINLTGLKLLEKPFSKIKVYNNDQDWFLCILKGVFFEGAGDPSRFDEILTVFRSWVES